MPNTLDEKDWQLLLTRIKDGECTPFLGAGACFGALPLGRDVALKWAREENYPLEDSGDLAKVAQFLAVEYDPMFPKKKIREEFENATPPDFTAPDELHGILADLPLPLYITTNYDDFLVQALKSRHRDPKREICRWNKFLQRKFPVSAIESACPPTPANPLVFHLHGHIEIKESLVLTEDDYLDFLRNISEDPKLLPARIEEAFSGTSLLFLGYSIADWDLRVIFRSLVSYLERSIGRAHISVQLMPIRGEDSEDFRIKLRNAQKYLDDYYGKLAIRMYWGTCQEFAAELRRRWEAFK